MKKLLACLPPLIALCFPSILFAEQKKRFDDYDIHYSIVNTTFLSTEVANTYKITRGKDRALINIAIRKIINDSTDAAEKAQISGESTDLMRAEPIQFTEIIEQNAIYYISEIKFYNLEMRHFTINIKPESSTKTYTLKFSKTLYKD